MVSNVFLQWAAGESCACQFTGAFCFFGHILLFFFVFCMFFFIFSFWYVLNILLLILHACNLLFCFARFPNLLFFCNVSTFCVFSAIFCSLQMSNTSKPEMWSLVKKSGENGTVLFLQRKSHKKQISNSGEFFKFLQFTLRRNVKQKNKNVEKSCLDSSSVYMHMQNPI